MFKITKIITLLAVTSLLLAACGGATQTPAATQPPAATEAPATEMPATEAPAPRLYEYGANPLCRRFTAAHPPI